MMIVSAEEEKYDQIFADIYNSAIELFDKKERGMASADVFSTTLKQDIKFIEVQEEGSFSGFISYRSCENNYEITALYVKKACQRQGTGERLLQFAEKRILEERTTKERILFVKILKNAPWSLEFYQKNGYRVPDQEEKKIADSIGIIEKPYSTVLCKRIAGW